MVVRKFNPSGNYRNGIIKYIYPTNKSEEIELKYPDVCSGLSHIYPSAFLDDERTYFQSTTSKTDLNMTFKKFLFLTHFAAIPHVDNNKAWNYPSNFSVTGCMNNKCIVLDSIMNSERYNVTKMVLTPINPGTFNYISISMNNSLHRANVLQRFEIFGYLCDSREECKWKNINRLNTCKINHHSKHNILFICYIISF